MYAPPGGSEPTEKKEKKDKKASSSGDGEPSKDESKSSSPPKEGSAAKADQRVEERPSRDQGAPKETTSQAPPSKVQLPGWMDSPTRTGPGVITNECVLIPSMGNAINALLQRQVPHRAGKRLAL